MACIGMGQPSDPGRGTRLCCTLPRSVPAPPPRCRRNWTPMARRRSLLATSRMTPGPKSRRVPRRRLPCVRPGGYNKAPLATVALANTSVATAALATADSPPPSKSVSSPASPSPSPPSPPPSHHPPSPSSRSQLPASPPPHTMKPAAHVPMRLLRPRCRRTAAAVTTTFAPSPSPPSSCCHRHRRLCNAACTPRAAAPAAPPPPAHTGTGHRHSRSTNHKRQNPAPRCAPSTLTVAGAAVLHLLKLNLTLLGGGPRRIR